MDVPDFKQSDGRWANIYLKDKTIGKVGCLLVCLSMKYSYHTGTTTYPDAMRSKLSFTRNSIYWSSIKKLGYYYSENNYNTRITDTIMATIYVKLKEGVPVIIGGASSTSTHWVVVTGYTGTDIGNLNPANFTINDPGSKTRTTLKQFLAVYPTVLRLIY